MERQVNSPIYSKKNPDGVKEAHENFKIKNMKK